MSVSLHTLSAEYLIPDVSISVSVNTMNFQRISSMVKRPLGRTEYAVKSSCGDLVQPRRRVALSKGPLILNSQVA